MYHSFILKNYFSALSIDNYLKGQPAIIQHVYNNQQKEVRKILAASPAEANNTIRKVEGVGDHGAGGTPLMIAVAKGHDAIVDNLLAVGADPNKTDESGISALILATVENRPGMVKKLCEHHAEEGFEVSVHLAAEHNPPHILQYLLSQQSLFVISTDEQGQTPLHKAAAFGNLPAAMVLERYWADVNARDNSRSTPLHMAASVGCLPVVEFLLQKGSAVDARNSNYNSASDLAYKYVLNKGWMLSKDNETLVQYKQIVTRLEEITHLFHVLKNHGLDELKDANNQKMLQDPDRPFWRNYQNQGVLQLAEANKDPKVLPFILAIRPKPTVQSLPQFHLGKTAVAAAKEKAKPYPSIYKKFGFF